MNKKTLKFIVDILNLTFGKGKETDYFWDSYLLPETIKNFKINEAIKYHQYQETIETVITKSFANLNAIFYALVYHFSLKLDADFNTSAPAAEFEYEGQRQRTEEQLRQRVEEYFSKFKKFEKPFGDPKQTWNRFEIQVKSKSYALRNIPYKEIFEHQTQFKNEQKIEEALDCARMKKLMNFSLNGKVDLQTLAEIAEIALDQEQNDVAKKYAEKGLKEILPLHSERIRFYCILIRAYSALDDFKQAERYFQLVTDTIFHHLGPSHPIHMTVYGIMANLLVPKGKMEEAMYLYKSSLFCCMKVLGPNHI